MIIDKGDKMAMTTKSSETLPLRISINPKAKRLILRVDERRREAVGVAPHKRMVPELMAFVEERSGWLKAQLAKIPEPCAVRNGAVIRLRDQPCKLSLEGSGRRPQLIDGAPQILLLPGDPETIGRRALRYLKSQARTDLARSVEHHAKTLGIKTGRISVKDTRSRWGSCTAQGDLSFSWRLIMAPPHALDYVAAHECAHRLEMNHSSVFWQHVERCRPDWRQSRDWLKAHGTALHSVEF
ncbi:MAG: SprT family zinc-dependent metalloprotease [Pseudomonadota bacterium]